MAERMLPEARFIDVDTVNLLKHVSADAPVGTGLNYEDIIPAQFLDHEFADDPQAELLNLIKPFVASVVVDFQEQTGRTANGIRRLDVMNQDSATNYNSQKWHRDKLFPGERLYVAAECQAPTEAVHGLDVCRFNRLPFAFPINGLTHALVSSRRFEVVKGERGQTAVLTSGVVHRAGQADSAPRASVSVAVYNYEQARSELINKRWEGRHLRRAERRDPFGF
ncbi:MAG: hypothetical protein ACXWLH_03510 [Candidatus Saccharimonadales bacterium]